MSDHDAKRATALLHALIEAEAQIRALKAELAETRRAPVLPRAPQIPPASVLTIDEASEALRVCRTKIYQLLNEGELSSSRIGRRRLILRDSLEALIARKAIDSPLRPE